MVMYRSILIFVGLLFHLSAATLKHSGQYLKFLASIKITFISDLIINSLFFLYGIFMWFFSKVDELKSPLFNGKIRKRTFIEVTQRTVFRSIHRKKYRKPVRLGKIISGLNYFGDYLISPLQLNKIFASITLFIVYIGLLVLVFRYFTHRLKRQTSKFLETGFFEVKPFVKIIKRCYLFVKSFNTINIIKTFLTRRKVYKPIIKLLSFIKDI